MPLLPQNTPENGSDPLKPENTLWRYVTIPTLFHYLSGSTFIPSLAKLREKEPFEAESWFDKIAFGGAMHEYPAIEKWLAVVPDGNDHNSPKPPVIGSTGASGYIVCLQRQYYEALRNTRYAWCWFEGESQSTLMWNSYGKGGAAIKTTFGKLSGALEKQPQTFANGRMQYKELHNANKTGASWDRTIQSKFLLDPHFLKRLEYKHEQEVRFVVADARKSGGGISLHMDPVDWIDEILLCPSMLKPEAASIIEAVGKISPDLKCLQSDLLRKEDDAFALSDDPYFQTEWIKFPEILKQPSQGPFVT